MKNNVCKPFCKPFRVNDIITVKLECTMSYYELRYSVNGRDIGDYNAINDDKDEVHKRRMEIDQNEDEEEDDSKNEILDQNLDENNDDENEDENENILYTDITNTNSNKNEKKKDEDDTSHINRHDRVAYRLPNDKVYEMVIALKHSIYKIKCISFQTKPFSYY